MNLEIRIDKEAPNDWNDNLQSSKISTVYHTVEYSNYAKTYLDWSPIFMSIFNSKGELLAKSLLFELSTNFKNISALKPLSQFSNKFKILKWLLGPVVFNEDLTNDVIFNFINYIEKSYPKVNGSFHPLLRFNFETSKHIMKWGTFLIDLTQSKNQIESNFDKRSVTKNIKRSIERGVEIFEITEKNISDYANLLNEFRKENDLTVYSLEQIIDLWKILKPTKYLGYIAYFNEKPIGGMTFSAFNGYINEWGVARSKLDFEQKLYSQDLIKWKIIEWGINNNQRFYDLTGFNPNPVSEKEQGILRYKRKWGGKQYDLFYYNRR